MDDIIKSLRDRLGLAEDADEQTLETALGSAEFLTDEARQTIQTNAFNTFNVKEQLTNLPTKIQKDLHAHFKGSTLADLDKALLEAHNKPEWKFGTEYTDTVDLVNKLIGSGTADDSAKKTLEDLRKQTVTLKQEKIAEYERGLSEANKNLQDIVLGYSAEAVASRLGEKPESKMEAVRLLFQQKFDLDQTENGFQCVNRASNQIEVDAKGVPKSVKTVLEEVAGALFPLNQNVPNPSREGNSKSSITTPPGGAKGNMTSEAWLEAVNNGTLKYESYQAQIEGYKKLVKGE